MTSLVLITLLYFSGLSCADNQVQAFDDAQEGIPSRNQQRTCSSRLIKWWFTPWSQEKKISCKVASVLGCFIGAGLLVLAIYKQPQPNISFSCVGNGSQPLADMHCYRPIGTCKRLQTTCVFDTTNNISLPLCTLPPDLQTIADLNNYAQDALLDHHCTVVDTCIQDMGRCRLPKPGAQEPWCDSSDLAKTKKNLDKC